MKSKIISFILLILTVITISSCLNDDSTDLVYYDDTAITGFSLSDFKYSVTLKNSKGEDSIVTKTGKGSDYKMYIDQANRRIYNVDSLPVATDLKHLLVNVTTKNNGVAAIKRTTSDSIDVVTSTDSLDFSVPREIIVYSHSGVNNAKYTVSIVAHQLYPDSFQWKNIAVDSRIAKYKAVKALPLKGRMYLLGTTETGAELLSTDLSDGKNWEIVKPDAGLSKPDAGLSCEATMVTNGNSIVISDLGTIYHWDGTTLICHESSGVNGMIESFRLVGYCGKELFAVAETGGIYVSYDDGFTWKADSTDADKALLPTDDINACSATTRTNKDISRIIMVGSSEKATSSALVWSKIVEQNSSCDLPWAYQEFSKGNRYKLPNMTNLSMTSYDGKLLVIGGEGRNGASVQPYGNIYVSEDCGISWHTDDSRFVIPAGFDGKGASITADGMGYIGIVAASSGQVWRGGINSLIWKK